MLGVNLPSVSSVLNWLSGATVGTAQNWLIKPIEDRLARLAFGLMLNTYETFSNAARDVWEDYGQKAYATMAEIVDLPIEYAWRLGTTVPAHWAQMTYAAARSMVEIGDGVLNKVGRSFAPIINALWDGVHWAYSRLSDLEWWRDVLRGAIDSINWAYDNVIRPTLDGLLNLTNWLEWTYHNVIEPTFRALWDWASWAGEQLYRLGARIDPLERFKDAAEFLFNNIIGRLNFLDAILAPISAFGSIFEFIASLFVDFLNGALEGLEEGIDEAFPVSDYFKRDI